VKIRLWLIFSIVAVLRLVLYSTESAQAQINPDGSTATQVNGNAISPTGSGTVRGGNLFHSFDRFNVSPLGVIFGTGNSSVNGASIQNILNRVTGNTPSEILGAIQSRQAFPNANFYLLNPNGIIFGANARLDIGGSFHASTATGIGFDPNQIFRTVKDSSFPFGEVRSIRFGVTQPAGIINQGDLAVSSGQTLALTGGTVVSSGSLTAPNGNVAVLSTSGNSIIELRSPDAVLGLSISPNKIPSDWQGSIAELPDLAKKLTGATTEANQVVINPDGSLGLVANSVGLTSTLTDGKFVTTGNLPIHAGDVAVKQISANNAQVTAIGNLALLVPQLETQGNLSLIAGNNLILRDSMANPSTVRAGGNLLLQGDRGIDILALNYAASRIESGGNLVLRSDGIISGDAHFASGGNFTVSSISGSVPNFISLYDPIISSNSDVSFGNYTGAALKVESRGSITSGDITITSPDLALPPGPPDTVDRNTLITSPSLILRAGLPVLANPPNIPPALLLGGATFTPSGVTSPGNITVGNISTSQAVGNAGSVTLQATGNITATSINAEAIAGNGGAINLNALGAINTGAGTVSSTTINGPGGNIIFQAGGNILTNNIQSLVTATGNSGNISLISTNGSINTSAGTVNSGATNGNAGNLTFQARGNITTADLLAEIFSGGSTGKGGNIALTSTTGNILTADISNQPKGGLPGTIALTANLGNITTNGIFSRNVAGNNTLGDGGAVTLNAGGNITANKIDSSSQLFLFVPGSAVVGKGGNVALTASGQINITTDITTTSFASSSVSAVGDIVRSNDAGNVTLNAGTSINIGNGIFTDSGTFILGGGSNVFTTNRGGNISLTAGTTVNVGDRLLSSAIRQGGNINVTAGGDINVVSDLDASSSFSSPSAVALFNNGGNVTVTTPGNITVGGGVNATAQAFSDLQAFTGNGGIIAIDAGGNLTAGVIHSFANAFSGIGIFASGNGGNVTLRGNTIRLDEIDAQSLDFSSGRGGAITAIFGTAFRALGTFVDRNGLIASISSSGFNNTGGNILIQRQNFTTFVVPPGSPFIIGNSAINGTAGAITAGNDSIAATPSQVSTVATSSIGRIQVNNGAISAPTPTPTPVPTPTPTPTPTPVPTPTPTPPPTPTPVPTPPPTPTPVPTPPPTPTPVPTPPPTPTPVPTPPPTPTPVPTPPPTPTPVTTPPPVPTPPPTPVPTPPPPAFLPPDPILQLPTPSAMQKVAFRDFVRTKADLAFKGNRLAVAFDAIEKGYVSELEDHIGRDLTVFNIGLDDGQQLMVDVSEITGIPSALVYPVIFEDRLELLIIPPKDKGKPFFRSVYDAPASKINRVIQDFHGNLQDPSSNDYLEQAQQLYNWIIRPVDARLQEMKIGMLVFVMDGGLRVIPAAAFHDGKQFLAERYASANLPSIRLTRLDPRDRNNSRILAMGLSQPIQDFSALPGAEVEIKAISSKVLTGNSFLNQQFTLDNLQDQRRKAQQSNQNYGIIHLATHAKFLSDTSGGSFIQFWDRQLRINQIKSLNLAAPLLEMLTLSACQTAVGTNLGISGFAVESGARSVMASLWQVEDTGTAPLMISFYKGFPTAASKSIAMQKAQISLISGTVRIENNKVIGIPGVAEISLPSTNITSLQHPFYWSSFLLVGNWL